MNVQKLTPIIP